MYGIFITWAVDIKATFIYKKNRSQSISCYKIVDVGLTCGLLFSTSCDLLPVCCNSCY